MGDTKSKVVGRAVPNEGFGGGDRRGRVDDIDEELALFRSRTGSVTACNSQRAMSLAAVLFGWFLGGRENGQKRECH